MTGRTNQPMQKRKLGSTKGGKEEVRRRRVTYTQTERLLVQYMIRPQQISDGKDWAQGV